MAATMSQSQIGWTQFASTLIRREHGDAEAEKWGHKDRRNDNEHQDSDISDASTSTNTRASRALKQKQSKQTCIVKNVKWSKTKLVFASNEQPTEEPAAFDEPTKAKTRAQRRAVEEIPAPPAPVQKETRREQRSDYWVTRDDKLRRSARAMNTMMSAE